jgi:ATP-binding cassette, subfamily B, bacterial
MKVKPKKSSTPANSTDPFHKQYGLFSNIRYILEAMKKYARILLLFIPIAMVCNILFSYLWTFLSKFIIDLIPQGNESGDTKKLFITVSVFCLIMLLLFFVRNWYKSLDWVKKVHVRMKVIMEKNHKNMTMPFEFTEDPKVLDASNKAD